MSFAATAAIGVGLGTAYAGRQSSKAAKESAGAQREASEQGIEFQREALEALRRDLDPYRQFGASALDPLASAIGFRPQYRQYSAQEQADQQAFDAQVEADRQAYQDQYGRQMEWLSLGLGGDPVPSFEEYRESLGRSTTPITSQDGKAVRVTRPFPGMVGDRMMRGFDGLMAQPSAPSIQPPSNEILDRAMQERLDYDPMNNSLLARAQEERLGFDPLSNSLLASAAERQMAFDPSKAMSPEILQNPLLKALQADVTRRLMANQAAKGKLGSGGTAEELQNRLVPQAIQFGLQMNELQRQDISDRARLGGAQVGLQEAAMAGREGLGFALDELQRAGTTGRLQAGLSQEDLQQRQIANLMDAARMGQASAAQAGAAGQSAASQMGNLSLAAGQASAAGTLGAAQARNQMVGGLLGAGMYGLGSFTPTATTGTFNTFQPTTGQFSQFTGL